MPNPTFSVIIPCYNQGAYLQQAISAALDQSPIPEVIVVNDGSTDSTSDVMLSFRDQIIGIHQTNSGVNAARNQGILRSTGEFLVFCDADDYLGPSYTREAAAFLMHDPTVDVLHGAANVIDSSGNHLTVYGGNDLGPDPFLSLLESCDGPPVTWLIRKSCFARAGIFDPEVTHSEDRDMWLRIAFQGYRFALCPLMTAVYREHPAGASKQAWAMWAGVRRVVLYHLHRSGNSLAFKRAADAAMQAQARRMRTSAAQMWRTPGQRLRVVGLLLRDLDLCFRILRTCF